MTQTQQQDVITALAADAEDVDRLVADITPETWQRETPAAGWTIAHQVAHLAATFRMAALAAAEPEAFTTMLEHLSPDFDANVRMALSAYLDDPPDVLLARWRQERDAAVKALAEVPPDQPLPWLVRPLPPPVLAMAGMMECFGHGQDIADALGVERERTDRLQYLAAFAVRTWDFGYQARGLTPPPVAFRFELTGPSGAEWTFGPDDAEQRISGPAVDFCLLVTRRRHRDDLALTATGVDANQWLDIAQAYRGPAGPGRQPGQFD
jgi:enediyne biosynthesis protein E11